ncbi:MAG: PEGA domain-containing protein, partial [Myxococcota bacterium]
MSALGLRRLPVLIATVLFFAAPTAAGAESGAKVLVLPYQPILRSVAQKKVKQATEYLAKELDNTDGISVLRGGVASTTSNKASLATVEMMIAQAGEAEAAKDIERAVTRWRAALASYEKNASALEDITPYLVAHHRLARALMWKGSDDEARAIMATAACLAPNFELSSGEYSRLYRRWFFEIAKDVVRERPGELMVKSALPGASVSLDGRAMDVAPVLISRVLPGKHIVTAKVDGVPPFGAVVQVKAAGQTEFVLDFAGVLGG